jgi:hypothetical protein
MIALAREACGAAEAPASPKQRWVFPRNFTDNSRA